MIVCRLRAVATVAFVWAVAWAPVGSSPGVRHVLINSRGIHSIVGFLSVFTVVGAVVGGICGTALAAALDVQP